VAPVDVLHFTDPGCPWAWSASPALAALRWRYGDQLRWRHVMIGLTESGTQYEDRGYTPERSARSQRAFRRFGMPLAAIPKTGMAGTSRACHAVIAVRLAAPEREWEALRALQALQFLSGDRLDDDDAIARAVGADAAGAIDTPEVLKAYERDRAEARRAAGSPAEAQGKTATSDGPVRFTAPSVVFRAGGRELVAGGFQSLMAYDVLLANLDPSLERRPAPERVEDAAAVFMDGTYTAEVAEMYAAGAAQETDAQAIEDALISAAAAGTVIRNGDRWRAASTL
jgi:protein-disulfide isomerase-like protein with CxxC motif